MTAISVASQPKSTLGQGQSRFYDHTTGSITATRLGNGVAVEYLGADQRWFFAFQAAGDTELAPGAYEQATDAAQAKADLPRLYIVSSATGHRGLVGRYVVKDLVFGTGQAVTSFRVVFEAREFDSAPGFFGEIWYNTQAPKPLPVQIVDVQPGPGGDFSAQLPPVANARRYEASNLAPGQTLTSNGRISGPISGARTQWVDGSVFTTDGEAGGLVILAAEAASDTYSLKMRSPRGEFVGQGLSYDYSLATGTFTAYRNFDNGVSIFYRGSGSSLDFWSLDFAAPFEAPLKFGDYLGATRFPFQDPSAPGLDVSGNGRGYNMSTGKFKVFEVEYGPGDEIVSFVATFEQVGDGGTRPMVGKVRYNAQAALSSAMEFRGMIDVQVSYTVTANNFPTSFVASGLPEGLTLDPVTGVISGIPRVAGIYLVEITATGPKSIATGTLRFVIGPIRPQFTGSTSALGAAGVPFRHELTIENEPIAVTAAGLPAGLSMDALGVITGLPTRGGAFQVYVTATNGAGSSTILFTLFISRLEKILHNVSTRAQVQNDTGVLIGGFVIEGPSAKQVLLRATGPSLANLLPAGTSVLADPTIELRDRNGTLIASNDDWRSNPAAVVTAIANSGFVPTNDREPALLQVLAPGSYTAIVRGKNGTSGIGLVEVFDLDPDSSRLVNLSTRGRVEAGSGAMIGGFVVSGTQSVRLVVRANGPSLSRAGLPSATLLADPTLEIYNSAGRLVGSSDDWRQQDTAAALTATGFAPIDDREPAMLVELPPGAYTAVVRGKNGTAGTALIEVFRLAE